MATRRRGTGTARRRPGGYSDAQKRSLAAALRLFAEHGVAGTSLQMIADDVGVTKAAIYHQFRSKEAIVNGVADEWVSDVEAAVSWAEAEPSQAQGRLVLLSSIIDLALARRSWTRVWQADPVMVRVLESHEAYLEVMDRVCALLAGRDGGSTSRVRTALLTSALSATTGSLCVATLDDETLRAELRYAAGRLFDLPESAAWRR